ncbi:TPA: hypothetical protein HA219_03550 [Candidatus Woesearchaeota archaeon]|nr:hypothetical protein [uncultured archaeon]AQS32030.1 hypothetical protein [uncultured archaeon]MBS3115223.1 hypothetical protein [Candidatus Woesearchaeota archaeon]HIH39769.1 hypothetical protein [Candidatus Woesearchaeota archaeon]
MGVFSKLLNLLARGKEKREFIDIYQDIYVLSSDLTRDIEELMLIKKDVLSHPWIYEGKDAKGILGLKKGEFVEEFLLPKLKYFEKVFLTAEKNAKHVPRDAILSEAQKLELERVMMFLEKIRRTVPSEKAVREIKGLGDREKIESLANITRGVTELAKEFKLEEEKESLAKMVTIGEVSPLVKRVFNQATEQNQFKAYVIKKEFKAIVREAKQLKSMKNSNWKIFWRSWWRKYPKFETDPTTGILEPHANMTMILGGQKKEVHLILR